MLRVLGGVLLDRISRNDSVPPLGLQPATKDLRERQVLRQKHDDRQTGHHEC
jgi:hypothetical protein